MQAVAGRSDKRQKINVCLNRMCIFIDSSSQCQTTSLVYTAGCRRNRYHSRSHARLAKVVYHVHSSLTDQSSNMTAAFETTWCIN